MKNLWKRFDVFTVAFAVAAVFSGITFVLDYRLAVSELALLCILTVIKVVYTRKVKDRLTEKVKSFSELLDYENASAFGQLTVACCVIEQDGTVLWFNNKFAQSFDITENSYESNIKHFIKRDNISKVIDGCGYRIKVDSKYFSIYSNKIPTDGEELYLLYLFDETKLRLIEREYYDTKPSVMLCVIDNADEVYQSFKESECAAIFSIIEQMIDNWASSYGALCRKYSNARMLIFVTEKALNKMINDKFSVLEEIRNLTYNDKNVEVTLSIGVGKENNITDSNNSAKQALDMAQSRGGDQVAIKHEAQYKFYGGLSEGFEKKNKVRTRLIAKTIAGIIKECDNVLIMGHRFSDFDSFGSAVGMYCIAKHFGIEANIVVDMKKTLATPLVDKFTEENKYAVLSPEEALRKIAENTLLIVVDTHKKSFTECPALVDKTDKVMVIDHHRKAVDFIDNTVVFYHMPNSSSASEMVTELAQYVDTKPFLDPLCAQAMYAGIMLDTRNFVIRTGVRTFEAAAYLRSRSANTVEAKKLFSNDMDIFRSRNAVIDNAEKYRDNCAISVFEQSCANIKLITSQAADEMLNIEGVMASFVLFRNGDEINISARSYGEINVQLIMESLGGGGHLAMSACQLPGLSMSDALEKLKKAIDKYLEI